MLSALDEEGCARVNGGALACRRGPFFAEATKGRLSAFPGGRESNEAKRRGGEVAERGVENWESGRGGEWERGWVGGLAVAMWGGG